MEIMLLIYIIMFRFVIVKYFLNYVDIINIVFFSILSLWSYFTYGFQKRDNLKDYSVIQTTIICYIFYYILIYILGLFFGFVSNFYSLKLFNIIKNVFVAICFYGVREMYRYMMIKSMNKRNKLSLVFIIGLFTLLDIIMEINIGDFSNVSSIFEFFEVSVIPNVAINLILSYLAYNFNYKALLVFILFYILPNYFMPIFPNLGNYFGSVLKLVFIYYCYYQYSYIIEKWECKEKYVKGNNKKISSVITIILIVMFVGMVSGLFKYHLFAIVSDSMIPYFSRGDSVLIEKVSVDETESLKVGDVIAFNYNNQMIVHRIVEIKNNGEYYSFITKGDNNPSVDSWILDYEDIYGKVKFVFKYIGIPSVELYDILNK